MRGAQLIVPQNAAEQTEYNSIIAQGRALRAFAHFQLLSYFSTDLKNDNALGVMLLDFVPTINQDIARSSNGQVFSLIESDLEFAFNNVQTNSSAKPWAFVSRNMINALRARMYAYRGNYTLSLQYSQWVLDNSGLSLSNGTAIPAGTIGSTAWHNSLVGSATVNNYRRMWNDQIQGESIWSLARYNVAGMQNMSGFYNTNQSNLGGAVLFDMGRKTFNLLNSGWDIRRYVYIDPTSIVAADYNTVVDYKNNDVLIVDKYPGITGAPLVNDIKIFRISEMLLLKAEALANSGQINGASQSVASILKSIRDLRSYAGARPLPIYTNATEAWADILLERRLELCFEGHRYMDLKRLGALANLTIDRDPLDCSTYTLTECSMPVTDNRFTFPIPLNELNGNDLIRNQQNPGY